MVVQVARTRITRDKAILILKDFVKNKLVLKKWYLKVKSNVKAIVLYGSVAKGLNRPDSDIDLLIILPLALEEKYTNGEYIYKFKGYDINIVLRSVERLRKLVWEKDVFQVEVFRNCQFIWEKDHEVRGLVRKMTAQAQACPYCPFKSKHLVMKEYQHWTLSLAESQFLIGWSHAILKRHVESFAALKDEEVVELKKVVGDYSKAMDATFKPDLLNVMQLGNYIRHVHVHLVPRYQEQRVFAGRVFRDKDYGKVVPQRWEPEQRLFLLKLRKKVQEKLEK